MLILKIILIPITLMLLITSLKDALEYRTSKEKGAVIVIIIYLFYIIFS